MSSKRNNRVGVLISCIVVFLMVISMISVAHSRQANFQATMEDSLIVAKEDGNISNFKVKKLDQKLFKCEYKVSIKRETNSKEEIAIVKANFLSPKHKLIEFKF